MKKKNLLLIAMIFVIAAMYGCQSQEKPLCRVVTQVDIACDHEGIPIRRHYTDTEKMEAVLLYLRLLNPGGAPTKNPDQIDADIYEITVSLSDGHKKVYRQKDHRYFREAIGGWQSIAPDRAARLYTLMRHYGSDL